MIPDPLEPPSQRRPPPASEAAEQARARLHEEIERVRSGVEEMLAERGEGQPRGRVDRLEERLLRLEGRLDQIEYERRYAEWRIFTNIETLLDNVLREMRTTADLLTRTR